MGSVGLCLYHVIVTTDVDTEHFLPTPALPGGVTADTLRITRADQVEAGDWYIGECSEPTDSRSRMMWGYPALRAFSALPRTREDNTVALNGTDFEHAPGDLVMICSRHCLPRPAYAPGERVERTIQIGCSVGEMRYLWYPHTIVQRGTVQSADHAEGTLTVDWDGDWGTFRTVSDELRHVDPQSVAYERSAYGYAVGDSILDTANMTRRAVALELWRDAGTRNRVVRICWQASGDQPAYTAVFWATGFAPDDLRPGLRYIVRPQGERWAVHDTTTGSEAGSADTEPTAEEQAAELSLAALAGTATTLEWEQRRPDDSVGHGAEATPAELAGFLAFHRCAQGTGTTYESAPDRIVIRYADGDVTTIRPVKR
jgi:hypothetical protein